MNNDWYKGNDQEKFLSWYVIIRQFDLVSKFIKYTLVGLLKPLTKKCEGKKCIDRSKGRKI